jgi:hypothetical protein
MSLTRLLAPLSRKCTFGIALRMGAQNILCDAIYAKMRTFARRSRYAYTCFHQALSYIRARVTVLYMQMFCAVRIKFGNNFNSLMRNKNNLNYEKSASRQPGRESSGTEGSRSFVCHSSSSGKE